MFLPACDIQEVCFKPVLTSKQNTSEIGVAERSLGE